MPKRIPRKLNDTLAIEQFYRGQLLPSVQLSPSDFFKALIPLYNQLNDDHRILSVHAEYIEGLKFDALDEN